VTAIDEIIGHLKATTISYPQWRDRKYAPGVRETTQWGQAFAKLNKLNTPAPTTSQATAPLPYNRT
jgi:hypothetical protein